MSASKDSSYQLKNQGLLPNAWKISAAIGAVGLVLAGVGFGSDSHRFGYSFLFGFICVVTVLFGAMFHVISQHVTQGHWSVTTRRIPELFLSASPVVLVFGILLMAGVATGKFHMFDEWIGASAGAGHHSAAPEHESHADAASSEAVDELHPPMPEHTPQMGRLHHEVLQHKASYLNSSRWLGFSAAYLLIWVAMSYYFFKKSVEQDSSKDKQLTNTMKSLAPAAAFVFGLSLTFACFDWVMASSPAGTPRSLVSSSSAAQR